MATLPNNLIIIWDKLKSVFTTVSNEVSNEINTRTEQYSSLSSAINSKADAADLNTEITNRQNADNTLQDSIDTLNNSKLTAPAPSNTGIRSIISDDGDITWNNVDTVAPKSLITEPYLSKRLKQIESINYLGIIEFAGSGEPVIDTALDGDLYMDYENNTLYRCNATQWNIEENTENITTGDFYDINVFVDFENESGTITWVNDVNGQQHYWYYRVDRKGETNLEVTTDNNSVNKNSNLELQIKDFASIPNDSFLTKINGQIASQALNSKADATDLNTEITNRQNADNTLQTNINTKANEVAVVKLSGNQTISDVKTFSSNPLSTAAQSNTTTALTRKDYVDNKINIAITDALGDIESVLANINSGGI